MRITLPRLGFIKRNLDQLSNATGRALSVGGLVGSAPDLELISFRQPSAVRDTIVFTDNVTGGYSTASLDAMPFSLPDIPPDFKRTAASQPPPHYGRFHGNVSIELPKNQPHVERSGFAAWRMADPGWTLLGRAQYNCEAHAFLALRLKADRSRYFVNVQVDSIVELDLYQHRLFAKTPGEWETVYIPFSDFVRTHMGKVLTSQGYIPKNNVKTVGLGLIDRIPGPFELCIDRIWSTNSRGLDSLDAGEAVE